MAIGYTEAVNAHRQNARARHRPLRVVKKRNEAVDEVRREGRRRLEGAPEEDDQR
jgi:hypothetical protein